MRRIGIKCQPFCGCIPSTGYKCHHSMPTPGRIGCADGTTRKSGPHKEAGHRGGQGLPQRFLRPRWSQALRHLRWRRRSSRRTQSSVTIKGRLKPRTRRRSGTTETATAGSPLAGSAEHGGRGSGGKTVQPVSKNLPRSQLQEASQ